MRAFFVRILIIMIHISLSSWAETSVDFNKEIDMVVKEQYETHLTALKQTAVTEAAVDFENRYRKPTPNEGLAFFPLKVRPKPSPRPRTKVAKATSAVQKRVDLIEISRKQLM